MPKKSLFRLITLCLLMLAVFACVSGGGSHGPKAELPQIEADIAVFPQMGHGVVVGSVAFSPDGKQVVSGDNRTVKIWDTETGREIRTFSGWGSSVNFSPDAKQVLASGGFRDHTFKLWNVATGQEIRTFSGHTGGVESVCFSPDGEQILSGSYDNTIKLWDVATGKEIRTFSGHTGEILSVAFSPDGRQILSGGGVRDHTVKLWDVATGQEIGTFLHTDLVSSVSFSPDGKQVLASSRDHKIKLWDVTTGQEIRTFSWGGTEVCFSPDGKQILSSGSIMTLWNTTTGEEIRTFSGEGGISISFSPDGKQVLSGSMDAFGMGIVKLWDVVTGREIRTFSGHSKQVNLVNFSPDGKYILSDHWDGTGDTITLWDATTGMKIRTFSWYTHTDIRSLVFSPDGKYLLTYSRFLMSDLGNSGYGNIRWDAVVLWDVTTGMKIRTFTENMRSLDSVNVCFSPDGKYVLYGYEDGTVKMWNATTGMELKNFSGHTGSIRSVSFSPDGKQILSGSSDKTVKLWDVVSGEEIRTFSGHTDWVSQVNFSPDGRQVLSGSEDKIVKLWDAITGKEVKTFSGHTKGVRLASFSPDGKQVLSYSWDYTVKLWDAITGREISTFTINENFNRVVFSPDGKQILSGSQDGTVRLWDVAAGKEISQFISFSGNDSQIASATRALTVKAQTAAASNEGEWLTITPDGFYQASPRGDRYLNVRVNNSVTGIDSFRSVFYNPDVVQARLQGKPDPASKANITIQQVAAFFPPTVTIQSPANFSTTSTATANLSVSVTDQNQPIRNVKILVNGRLVGRNELSAVKGASGLHPQNASFTVTGNQKTLNFNLPLNLDPGDNIIEVVAFNGYSENRSRTEITWDAPAGQQPPLPNLWILAVGVNDYNDANIQNLNYAVADAKGLIDSLKAQEGRRYGKVNSLLIADEEQISPTAANIRRNLRFLDNAGERDVVLLFLAGHGISANAGKFLFLPNDVRLRGETVVESSAISDNDIVKVLDRAGNLLVFIDACQSGGVDNDRLVRSLMDTNAFVFASSRGYEKSQERREFGHGVFTYSIIEGLKGPAAAQAQGNVTVLSLSGFVSDDVPRITGGAQNPKAYSLGFCDFPMAIFRQ